MWTVPIPDTFPPTGEDDPRAPVPVAVRPNGAGASGPSPSCAGTRSGSTSLDRYRVVLSVSVTWNHLAVRYPPANQEGTHVPPSPLRTRRPADVVVPPSPPPPDGFASGVVSPERPGILGRRGEDGRYAHSHDLKRLSRSTTESLYAVVRPADETDRNGARRV